jgi:hypothetical protein
MIFSCGGRSIDLGNDDKTHTKGTSLCVLEWHSSSATVYADFGNSQFRITLPGNCASVTPANGLFPIISVDRSAVSERIVAVTNTSARFYFGSFQTTSDQSHRPDHGWGFIT